MPLRVAILGNSGSGKSTLARQLAAGTDAAVLDLDTVAWVPGEGARPRDADEAAAEVRAFCTAHADWVVEGCYAALVEVTLAHAPLLMLLDPGREQCEANCRARPWEPHKFASPEAQQAALPALLAWVAEYYTRTGDLSLAAHTRLFERYTGPKQRVGRGHVP